VPKRIASNIGVVLVLGCTSSLPAGSELSGSWGGWEVQLTANSAGADIQFPCFHIHFPGPVVVTSADSFDVAGVVTTATWAAQIGQERHIYGKIVSPDTLRLWESYQTVGTTPIQWLGPYLDVMIAGQQASFANAICSY
jgi:hypothetical protein